ncbi:sensor domain-containing diguanylate cyclase [Leucothrix sargassi]|nr:sensor domain-containing diguanylate cyclase [Leucothrix sargassi]
MISSHQPIAKVTLALLISLQLLTVCIFLYITRYCGEDTYLDHVRGLMKTVATESVQSVDSLLAPAEDMIRATRNLIETDIISNQPDEKLERYLFEQVRNNVNFSGMSFGWVNGDYLHVAHSQKMGAATPYFSKYITAEKSPDRKLREHINRDKDFQAISIEQEINDYDPRTRPWFTNVSLTPKLSWTRPYLYFATCKPGITVSVPVHDKEGQPVGVLGVDLEINNLSYFLNKNQLSVNSSAFITDSQSNVVAHTDVDTLSLAGLEGKSDFSLLSVSDLNSGLVNTAFRVWESIDKPLANPGVQDIRFDYNGEAYHAAFHSYQRPGLDWTVVVTAPESDFIGAIRDSQLRRILISLASSILITLGAFFLAAHFLRPVKELQETVLRDALTGLYNRRALMGLGDQLVKQAHSKGQRVSIAMIDIDHFKKINDEFGHAIGDEVLISVAQRMQRVLQKTDMLVRYGGEEFALVLFNADIKIAKMACERVRKAVSGDQILTDAGFISVTISMGVVEMANDDDYIPQSLNLADQALYISKREGRNRITTHIDKL